jgi:hypothetical protein
MFPRFGPGSVGGEEIDDGSILHDQASHPDAQNCANQDIRIDDQHFSVCLSVVRDGHS